MRNVPTHNPSSPEDLGYFTEWRQWLWRRPIEISLDFLGDLEGKKVLEIGGRSGRMSCLFARRGCTLQ